MFGTLNDIFYSMEATESSLVYVAFCRRSIQSNYFFLIIYNTILKANIPLLSLIITRSPSWITGWWKNIKPPYSTWNWISKKVFIFILAADIYIQPYSCWKATVLISYTCPNSNRPLHSIIVIQKRLNDVHDLHVMYLIYKNRLY